VDRLQKEPRPSMEQGGSSLLQVKRNPKPCSRGIVKISCPPYLGISAQQGPKPGAFAISTFERLPADKDQALSI